MAPFSPITAATHPFGTLEGVDPVDAAAGRLAALLTGGGDGLRDPTGRDLVFDGSLALTPLAPLDPPSQAWAVDGGQALVADARAVQLYVTRAATVRFEGGEIVEEDEGVLRPHVLGCGEERTTLAALHSPIPPASSVDVNLLRDWGEWEAAAAAIDAAAPGAVVLVDGDLQPDWRIPAAWVAELLERAAARRVVPVGITKHSSLVLGGAPLLGVLERRAAEALGSRARWWAPVASTRPDLGPGLQVLVARLDPDARFAFRVDLPGGVDPAGVLGRLAAIADDAAFPGYPYPLSVADRLAACPPWLKADLWHRVSATLVAAGVPLDVIERAFADRHRLMERA